MKSSTAIGVSAKVKPITDPSFVEGRVGSIDLGAGGTGVLGELHPAVLVNFGVEAPCVAFELELADEWAK